MLLLLDLPVSLQRGDLMAPKSVNRSVCARACDIEMPVQAQFILLKRLLHNTVKVNETLSNYLPRMCQSCKFNLPSASNFPPEYVSISHSDRCDVMLLIFSILASHPTQSCVPGPSAPKPRWQPLILSKLCEKAFLRCFSSWCFVKIRLMQSINLGRIKP